MRRVSTFVPIETKIRRGVPELVADSSQAAITESIEVEGTKRSTEEELGQQSSKKQKTYELSQEELQQLMIIVPEERMNVEALQTKYPILTGRFALKIEECTGKSSGWVITQRFNLTEPTADKEIELWVELKRLFEPDVEDELWKLKDQEDEVFRRILSRFNSRNLMIWRIEQYFQVQDYALWDVIENGNSFKPAAQTTTNADGSSTTLIPGPITANEKNQKKNDVKARSMLLMALPNEHLLTFNQYKDAKTLFAVIQTRFGDCKSTDILDENISQEDLNLTFLRKSMPSEKTSRKITINGSDTAGYDKSKVECFNCHKMGHFARECRGPRNQDSRNRNQDSSRRTVDVEETSFKAMVAIDGAGFDWSYMTDDEVPTNMALMAFSDSE
ncbi:ribonuclease H-like domain-containing protein, partial [Tanacetum coccineum]